MHIGVVFPQTELGGDVGAVRAYALRVAELGYHHVLAYDHVVGADPEVHTPWQGPYDVTTTFHEPFVLFGYMAAITELEMVTGIIILPQRQTALVAKQAAEVDLLTRGRFRLGIGLGWNAVEYEALGQDFTTRGRRVEEQVDLLRRLWTERSVTYEGSFDRVTGAGLAPLPWVPRCTAPRPMASRTGRARSSVSAAPPTRNSSSPAAAWTLLPVTGASRKAHPRVSAACAR
jgi:probable F420-dependent oxidoreductase